MTHKTIDEGVLRAITLVLQEFSPQYLGAIKHLVESSNTEAPASGLGSSVYGKLTGSIDQTTGLAILDILKTVHSKLDGTASFDGFQINYLVSTWEYFVAPPKLNP